MFIKYWPVVLMVCSGLVSVHGNTADVSEKNDPVFTPVNAFPQDVGMGFSYSKNGYSTIAYDAGYRLTHAEGFWFSTDGGLSWQKLPGNEGSWDQVSFSPNQESNLIGFNLIRKNQPLTSSHEMAFNSYDEYRRYVIF